MYWFPDHPTYSYPGLNAAVLSCVGKSYARWRNRCWLHSTAANDVDQNHDHGNHQQHMNDSAQCVTGHRPKSQRTISTTANVYNILCSFWYRSDASAGVFLHQPTATL